METALPTSMSKHRSSGRSRDRSRRASTDMEDTFRRAIIQVGDVSRIAVQIDLSLPALKKRVDAGESIQPAWGQFVERLTQRYGLPTGPRVRHVKMAGPLATMVIAYRR